MSDVLVELQAYGAMASQLVDIGDDREPRVLGYLDLRVSSDGWRRPVVVESSGRPCVHVFDGRSGVQDDQLVRWCWRIALRGDGAWVGVLLPGKLQIYSVSLSNDEIHPKGEFVATPEDWVLPKLLQGVVTGQDHLPRRRYLLQLLERSARKAIGYGLSQVDALSLVGRGLFWRFLLDRGVLKHLSPRDVCDEALTWESCMDSKARALKTFKWLDDTFNGGLLPFEGDPSDFEEVLFCQVLANISYGATETGQLRLPTDWDEVDFSFVPVGLLSEVYEAFAHNLNAIEATQKSIHYTPVYLADFVVSQALDQVPSAERPRVLDPAVGAGVFLVTAFRKLVEREWRSSGERPKRPKIRQILNDQLAGLDVDARALRLTELALYLTALELDPDPKPLDDLKFTTLRDRVLFDLSTVKHGSLGPVAENLKGQFDLVIGNPPWTAVSGAIKAKKAWVANSVDTVRERLGECGVAGFDFPDTNMDLPFFWRAMEWAKPGAGIALITHARWLFGISNRSTLARNNLLQALRITGVLNGSALRKSEVWPNVNAPWCIVFAKNELPNPIESAAFHFVSPALESEVDSRQTKMRIDWQDAQTILVKEILEFPWMLKARFKGNRLAARAFETMHARGIELGCYMKRVGIDFKNGYQVGGKKGKKKDASAMHGMPDTKGVESLGFVVNAELLPKFKQTNLLFPRDPSIYRAPLLLVRKSVPSDPLTPRASRSESDLAYHESYHGISFAGISDSDILSRYIQLWLQSSLMVFSELFVDGLYGVERDSIYQESLYKLPIVPIEDLTERHRQKIFLLSGKMEAGLTSDLAQEIDEFVFDVFDFLPLDRDSIIDTVNTCLPSTRAKCAALAMTKAFDRSVFVETLKDCLASTINVAGKSIDVVERDDLNRELWRFVEIKIDGKNDQAVPFPFIDFLKKINETGASLVVMYATETLWYVGLVDRYYHWTKTRARMLATDLLTGRPWK